MLVHKIIFLQLSGLPAKSLKKNGNIQEMTAWINKQLLFPHTVHHTIHDVPINNSKTRLCSTQEQKKKILVGYINVPN